MGRLARGVAGLACFDGRMVSKPCANGNASWRFHRTSPNSEKSSCNARPDHSALMLAALMIGVQRAISLVTRAASDCGPRFDLAGMSQPRSSRRLRTFSSSSALSSASVSMSRAAFGVPLGANKAFQADALNSGKAGFLRCRDIRQGRTALGSADCINLSRATLNVRNRVRHDVAYVIDLPAEQGIHGRRGAVERDKGRLHAEQRMKQQAGGVCNRTDAGMRGVHLF